jgi:hypothetical protein
MNAQRSGFWLATANVTIAAARTAATALPIDVIIPIAIASGTLSP